MASLCRQLGLLGKGTPAHLLRHTWEPNRVAERRLGQWCEQGGREAAGAWAAALHGPQGLQQGKGPAPLSPAGSLSPRARLTACSWPSPRPLAGAHSGQGSCRPRVPASGLHGPQTGGFHQQNQSRKGPSGDSWLHVSGGGARLGMRVWSRREGADVSWACPSPKAGCQPPSQHCECSQPAHLPSR